MSAGLETLLGSLAARLERHQQIVDSYPDDADMDSSFRWNLAQIGHLEEQIDRVINLLDRG